MYMMITGCKILNSVPGAENTVFEVILTPLSGVKQDIDLAGLVDQGGGGLLGIIDKVKQSAIDITSTVKMTQKEWIEHKYCIGRHVTLELLPDDTTGGKIL